MVTGLLSFVGFVLSFALLSNGQINTEQCPSSPTLSPQEYIIRFHEGYEWTQHLNYLASTVPSLWTSGFKANNILNGYTAIIPEDVLPYVTADPNVWAISDTGYIYVPGNKTATCNIMKDEQERLARNAAEDEETRSRVEQPQWIGKHVIIGLRSTISVHEHLASIPASVHQQVEQIIPEINGYALPALFALHPSADTTLDNLRKDPNIGFIVTKPRGFFSPEGGKGLQGDEQEDYEVERLWSSLQSQDASIQTTDDGDVLIPLSWKLSFSTPETKTAHMDSLPDDLFQRITWNRTKDYFITFVSSEQETTWLDIVNKDSGIVNIRPLREYLVNDGEMWEESTQSWRQLEHWQGYW